MSIGKAIETKKTINNLGCFLIRPQNIYWHR